MTSLGAAALSHLRPGRVSLVATGAEASLLLITKDLLMSLTLKKDKCHKHSNLYPEFTRNFYKLSKERQTPPNGDIDQRQSKNRKQETQMIDKCSQHY